MLLPAIDRRHDIYAVNVAGLAVANSGPDLIHTLLGLFDHLNCFVPLLLESDFCALNLHFFDVYPPVDLLLLCVVSSWGALVILEQFLNVFLFLLLTQQKAIFSKLDQFLVISILQL